MAPLTKTFDSKSLESQTIAGLIMEAARLRKRLSETRKEIESRDAKLASLKEVGEELTAIKIE